jgi:hypothetical protein
LINWIRLIVWLAIGLVVYFLYSRHHSRIQQMDAAGTLKNERFGG